MRYRFTPHAVITQYRSRAIAGLLLLSILLTLVTGITIPTQSLATTTVTWEGSELVEGTVTNATTTNDTIALTPTEQVVDDTREEFIVGNNQSDLFIATAYLEEGGIQINEGYAYSTQSNLGLAGNSVNHTFLHNNLLYVSTDGGLSVINTQGTADPSDDTLVTRYHTGSLPALANNSVMNSQLDLISSLLYVTTYDGGVSVIHISDPFDPSDDTLVTRYHTGSTIALSDNRVTRSHFDSSTGLLFISGWYSNGVYVIDTQNTTDPSDDALVVRYSTVSSPVSFVATGSWPNDVNSIWYDPDSSFLYINHWQNGLYVIDMGDPYDPSDDTLVTRYHTGSTPALERNNVFHSFLQDNILYVLTRGGGLSVINTQGTTDPTDDTLVTRYHTGSTPALADNDVPHSFLADDLLYISTYDGLSVINTQGTTDPTDDTLVTRYHTGSTPALADNDVYHSFLADDLLYISTDGGLSVVTPDKFFTPGLYQSNPRRIDTVPTTTITINSIETSDHTLDLSYRTGTSSAVWRDDFDTIDNYAGDLYGWGEEFQNATVTDGALTVSNPTDDEYGFLWIDTGFPDDYFAVGSVITARVRFNSDEEKIFNDWMYVDEWEGSSVQYDNQGEWGIVTLVADTPFSDIGFEPYLPFDTWDPTDSWQIDYLQITTPDSMGHWNTWQSCPDNVCILPDISTSTYLQYKLDLSTTDPSTTPIVHAVSYNGPYYSSGTYTSPTETFRRTNTLGTFTADVDTSASTSVSFTYTTDGGDTWLPIAHGDTFPEDTITETIQWRATLTTTDGRYTPTINSVSITATPEILTGTRIEDRITKLKDLTSPEAEAILRQYYPEYFLNPDAPLAKEKAIIVLLAEVLRLLTLLETIKAEESA